MKSILDPVYLPILHKYLERGTLMAFDYDGTLAPIVDDPRCAEMRPKTRELLRQLAMRYRTAVITGRGRMETLGFLEGIPLLEVIGNHGAESRGTKPHYIIQRVANWRRELGKALEVMEGVVLEDKRYSLSIHYRQSHDKDVVSKIMRLTENLHDARRIGGKSILNVLPSEAPGKAAALLRLCERFRIPRAIFVGDDDTDEDVFIAAKADRVLGIRVGAIEKTSAHYYINDQRDIDLLLEAMLT
ncbi:MAG TPA: trehalose-phosphatase [Gammaproteobacteria bacterium]